MFSVPCSLSLVLSYADAGKTFVLSPEGLRETADNLLATVARMGISLTPALTRGDGKEALRRVFEAAIRDGESEHNMKIYIDRIGKLAV